jgi:hypothetical protein
MSDAPDEDRHVIWKKPTQPLQQELATLARLWGLLEALNPPQRKRVMAWLQDVFGDRA